MWTICIGICTDGAHSMSGLQWLIQDSEDNNTEPNFITGKMKLKILRIKDIFRIFIFKIYSSINFMYNYLTHHVPKISKVT